jgi:hypothetical protein
MVAKFVKEFVLVFFLFMYTISCWLLLMSSLPTLVCEGELVGPPFPEIDYVSGEDEGITTTSTRHPPTPQQTTTTTPTTTNPSEKESSIVTTATSIINKTNIPTPQNTTDIPTPQNTKVEEERLALANAKFDLCCRQADINSAGNSEQQKKKKLKQKNKF